MTRLFTLITVGLLAALGALKASAADFTSAPVVTGEAESRLLAEGPFVPGETTWLLLDQRLNPGWHVYWKNPGDTGLPLVLDWQLPRGFEAGEPLYPVPERIEVGPLVNYGFHGSPGFLVPVNVPGTAEPGQIMPVTVSATWLICEDICIPEEADFALDVAVAASGGTQKHHAERFARAREALPKAAPFSGVFQTHADSLTLQFDLSGDMVAGDLTNAYFFAAREGVITASAPQRFVLDGTQLRLEAAPGFDVDRVKSSGFDGVLKLETDAGTVGWRTTLSPGSVASMSSVSPEQATANVQSGPRDASAAGNQPGFLALLALAFLGGILLNVMPCVFPILFIKASALMKASGVSTEQARRHGILYTAGVLSAFGTLASLLFVLRGQGAALGWGFHLQSPVIVLVSGYILFLVGLNLAGLYSVGGSLAGVGQGLTERQGGLGAFFTGLLAVIVAAPCIGPLLSLPVGAAIFLPPVSGVLIFLAMGLGLALPFLALSFVPALGRWLPAPGRWMETLKQGLSFPVFAASAFFLWVLTAQTGQAGLSLALGGAVALAFAAWLFERAKTASDRVRRIVLGGAGLLVMGILVASFQIPSGSVQQADKTAAQRFDHGALQARAFDPQEIAVLNDQGVDVFVDFTAAWCVTCQFNKLTIFSSPEIAAAFRASNTEFMVADWTLRDPVITRTLERFNRNGVPLYVLYPADDAPRVVDMPISKRAIAALLRAQEAVALN